MEYIQKEFKLQRKKTDEGINTLTHMMESRFRKNNEDNKIAKETSKQEISIIRDNLSKNYWPHSKTTQYVDKLFNREVEDINNRITCIGLTQ